MDSTYVATSVHLRGEVDHTDGRAVLHHDVPIGSVAIYLPDGNVTVSADRPDVLRSLAKAFERAADEIEFLAEHEAVVA